jgi:hypothetical protein
MQRLSIAGGKLMHGLHAVAAVSVSQASCRTRQARNYTQLIVC